MTETIEVNDWHEYINEPKLLFKQRKKPNSYSPSKELVDLNNEYTEKIRAIDTRYRPYLQNQWVSVMKSTFPQAVIKEKTKKFPGSEKYPPYAFRLQCTVTGRQSKYIKIDDYPYYGILPSDAQTGGSYPFKMDIPNKIKPIQDEYSAARSAAYAKFRKSYDLIANSNGLVNPEYAEYLDAMHQSNNEWFSRYNEYLLSSEWTAKRKQVLEIDNNECIVTGKKDHLQVHHITYQNVGKEEIRELLTLNKDIHIGLHDSPKVKRRVVEFGCLGYRKYGAFSVFDISDSWFEIYSYPEGYYGYTQELAVEKKEYYQEILINLDNKRQ